jgi:type I restriction enzyme S subunit
LTSEQQSLSEAKDGSHTSESQKYDEVPLSEVIDPVLGKTPKRSNEDYWEGSIKWASAKDISQNNTRKIYDTAEYMTSEGKDASNAKKMPEGTLVVIARGTLGRSAQLGEPMTFNQTCYGLDADNSELLDDFLYYAWNFRFNQIQSVSHGTVFDTITMDSFKDIDIPLPPLETQKKICNVLTSIDDKIEVNNRIDEILEEMAQVIFKSRFIDFDLYEKFKKSAVGKIPNSFQVVNLDDLIWSGRGYSYTSDHLDKGNKLNESYPMINLKNVHEGGGFRNDGYKYYTETPMKDRYKIETGDLILAITDLTQEGRVIGSPALIPDLDNDINIISQDVAKIVPEVANRVFFYHLFKSMKFQDYSRSVSTGTTVLHLSLKSIAEFEFALPPESDINEFSDITKYLHIQKRKIIKENDALRSLRDTLLPKLMSGELSVAEISLDDLEVDSKV